MPYEESLHIENDGPERDIIRLYDIEQALVLDHDNDPYHIQLIDMKTGNILKRFAYGQENEDDYSGLAGHSFEVSPRHNYLIIKEVQNGVSLDTLYACLYCLKDKPIADLSTNDSVSPHPSSYFQSHYFLTLLFSNDEHEDTVWVHGQSIDQLNTIDVYQFGGTQAPLGGEDNKLAKMYIETTYPAVALETKLRDRAFKISLNNHQVVNTLHDIMAASDQELCALYTVNLIPPNIPSLLKAAGLDKETPSLLFSHSFIGSRTLNGDVAGFMREIGSLALDCQLLAHDNRYEKPFDKLCVHVPISAMPTFNSQSIILLSQLAQKHFLVYDGFQLASSAATLTWDNAGDNSYALYRQLCNMVANHELTMQSFCEHFGRLSMKHQIHGVVQLFSDVQNEAIADIALVLSQFDDYDKTEEEVTSVIAKICG